MKWLFFILLLVNLGLFLLIYPQQQGMEAEPVLPDVGGLILAREAKQPVVAEAADKEASASEVPSDEKQSQLSVPVVTQEQSEDPPQAEVLEPESPLSVPDSEPLVEAPPSVAALAPSPLCTMVGFVETRSAAEQISVRLRALGVKPELQSETRNEQAGFWVLIPPQATRREAVEIANSLEKAGVSDMWRFTSGDLVRAISLGLFRDEERAAVRKREIDALGYESVIQPRYRQKTNYWIRYKTEGPSPVSAQDWTGLVNDFPGLVSKAIDCQ